MSVLWKWISQRKLSRGNKARLFLLLNSLIYSVAGILAWLLVRKFALGTWDWALCFVGYPGFFIGYIGGFLFLCQKERNL